MAQNKVVLFHGCGRIQRVDSRTVLMAIYFVVGDKQDLSKKLNKILDRQMEWGCYPGKGPRICRAGA